ncbi:MAG: 30S ribosomal protein S16 [Chlamydiota bacterium]
MALVIRLRQQGKNNRQSYRLVVADRRSPRDGKYVENLGWYDPFLPTENNFTIKMDRIQYWLDHGAILSDRARIFVKKASPEVSKAQHEKKIAKKMKEKKKK